MVGGSLGGVAAALAATQMGRRVILTEETEWIGGQATMTAGDVLTPRGFPDTVVKGGHPIDIHVPGSLSQHARLR